MFVSNSQQIQSSGSGVRIINGNTQKRMPISTDNVLYMTNVLCELKNMIIIKNTPKYGVYHQALLVITSKTDSQVINPQMKFHIVEYMGDSQVYGYQINVKLHDNPKYLFQLKKFEDEEIIWETIPNEQVVFSSKNMSISVNEIIEEMKKLAGDYKWYKNNCQDIAKKLSARVLKLQLQKHNYKDILGMII